MSAVKIALYMRLSKEDDTDRESNSIQGQRDLMYFYIKNHFSQSVQIEEWVDDGYSGTNFRRPAIQQLLEKAKNQELDCIIVKDFSRLGRDYISVGTLMEQWFPSWGIRFISVNDGYDSDKGAETPTVLETGFQTLIYDLYSKDLSEKVRSAKRTRLYQGEENSLLPIYGYEKENGQWQIEPTAARIVQEIYELADNGYSTTEIAVRLNQENIPIPSVHKKKETMKEKSEGNKGWTRTMVFRILHEERYTGKMIAGKLQRIRPGNSNIKKLPKEQWIVLDNAHEAIISKEFFMQIQEKLKTKRKSVKGQQREPFFRNIKCGICHYTLRRRRNDFYCETANYQNCGCMKEKIKILPFLEMLSFVITKHIAVSCKKDAVEKYVLEKQNQELDLKRRMLEKESYLLKQYKKEVQKKYEAVKEKSCTEQEFLQMQEKLYIKSELLNKKKYAFVETNTQESMEHFLNTFCKDRIQEVMIYNPYQIEIVVDYQLD